MDSESNLVMLEHSYAFVADTLKRTKVEEDEIVIKYEVLDEADANQSDEYFDLDVSSVGQTFKSYSRLNNHTLLSEVSDEECKFNNPMNHLELEDNCNVVNKVNLSVPANDDLVDTDAKEILECHQHYEKMKTKEKTCRCCFKTRCNFKTKGGESKRIKLEHSYALISDTLERTNVEVDDTVIKHEVLGEADAIQSDEYLDLEVSHVEKHFKSYLHSNSTTLLSEVSDEECKFQTQTNHLEDNCNLVNNINLSVAMNPELVETGSTEILEFHQNYEKKKTEERICRFCFRMCCNFKTIAGDIKDVLNVVLSGIDLSAIQEPVMCTPCEEVLSNSFDFKARCLYTHDYLIPIVKKQNDDVKLNLKDIYKTKHKNNISALEDQNLCGFCMCLVKNCSAIYLDVGERDVMLRKTLRQCLPELDFSVIEAPVMCAPCHAALENHSRFVTNILIGEEKIAKHKESLDINSKSQIDLSSLLQFIESEVDGNGGDVVKLGKKTLGHNESVDKEVALDTDDLKVNNEKMLGCKIESNDIDAIKIEESVCEEDGTEFNEGNTIEVEDQKLLFDEEIEIKTDELDFNRYEEGQVMTQQRVNNKLNEKQECSELRIYEDNLLKWHTEQTSVEQNVTKIRTHVCECCSFPTENKYHLKKHLLMHKNHSEATRYKCYSCAYQTIRKCCLEAHLLIHKNPSEVTMHKCSSCAYQTIHKGALKTHLLVHKNPSEVTMHKCDSCTYQTIHKSNLIAHLLKHKDIPGVTKYKCDLCLYRTKYKMTFKKHLLKHKNSSEVTMHKCDSCLYQTKYKGRFKRHLLTHRNPSKVTIHKCSSCAYHTKHKGALKTHLLMHKNPEIKMYKCDSCAYQTIHKGALKTHLLKHKDISEVTMYKCDSCLHQTKYKRAFKTHLLNHKNSSEVTMLKCDSCLYQTKYKAAFKRHLQKHNCSEQT